MCTSTLDAVPKVDLAPLSREELLAFTINLYNALIIHALVALNLTRMSTSQRSIFYSRTAKYNIGADKYIGPIQQDGSNFSPNPS